LDQKWAQQGHNSGGAYQQTTLNLHRRLIASGKLYSDYI